ncbi:hypothetical protein GOV14_04885 [Candidatus Pacearchaeota archaeon]|nr:hypothetical protein [Candidatus Pacearchaeota archaeon]
MVDLGKIKDEVAQIGAKYKDGFVNYQNSKAYARIAKGIDAIDEIRKLTGDLSDKVEEGDKAIQGTIALVKQSQGETEQGNESALLNLKSMYEGEAGFFGRALYRVTGRKTPSLKKSLQIVENIAQQIPVYVSSLSSELDERKRDLTQFRSELRNDAERLIGLKSPLYDDINQLETIIVNLESECEDLEAQRREHLDQKQQNSPELISKLRLLELTLDDAKDQYTQLKDRDGYIEGSVKMINSQIDKIRDQAELLDVSRQATSLAKDFVEIQVPYVVNDVRAQRSQVRALTGVNQATDFLKNQAVASGEINSRIREAAEFLNGKVDRVKDEIVSRSTIYSDRKRIASREVKPRFLISSPETSE